VRGGKRVKSESSNQAIKSINQSVSQGNMNGNMQTGPVREPSERLAFVYL